MNIQLIETVIIIVVGLLFSMNDSSVNRKRYIMIIIAILWFIGSMRSNRTGIDVGGDTLGYCTLFHNTISESWRKMWQSVVMRYVHGLGEDDLGYAVLQKTIGLFTHNWNVFSLIAQSLFFIPFGKLLYRFSSHVSQLMFAFIFYVALGQVFILFGARQMYAVGLCLISFLFVLNGKYTKSVLILLLASTIHLSCLVFLAPIILSCFKAKTIKIVHLLSFFFIPLVFIAGNHIINMMGRLIGMEKYAAYGDVISGGGITFFLLLEILSFFCYIAIDRLFLTENIIWKKVYAILPFVTFLGGFLFINGALVRLSFYFHIFMTILFPVAIDRFFQRHKERHIVYLVVVSVLALMILMGSGATYHFFWQESQYLM